MDEPTTPAKDPREGVKRREASYLRGEIMRITGRNYTIGLEALDLESIRELRRFVRDIATEKQIAVNNARRMPWRR